MIIGVFRVTIQCCLDILEMGFINLMCDVVVGGTHQTLLSVIKGFLRKMVATISLFICNYMDYAWFYIIALAIAIIVVVKTKKYSIVLDNSSLNDFKIFKELS